MRVALGAPLADERRALLLGLLRERAHAAADIQHPHPGREGALVECPAVDPAVTAVHDAQQQPPHRALRGGAVAE